MQPQDQTIQLREVKLHLRVWQPAVTRPNPPAFLLLHGLSSNARTWDRVAGQLAQAGYLAVAADQRGHGLSDKPEAGYDFATITRDLKELVAALGMDRPILAGQSWGGNVVLEAAARYPEISRGLVFVDGGFLELGSRGKWEDVSRELRPPDLAGLPRAEIVNRIGEMFPEWVPEGVEMTLGNFQQFEDGTVRPWLPLRHHMAILRALYDQDVEALFPQVHLPVLICPADDGTDWSERKRTQVENAAARLPHAEVHWFIGAAHDIHVDQPVHLAQAMLAFAARLEKSL